MARFCSLFSSSSGNCTYIGCGSKGILIDAGVSAKQITYSLNCIGVQLSDIGAIFLTHEHSDHIKGVRVLAKRNNINVFSSAGTLEAMELSGDADGSYRISSIESGGVEVCGMMVNAFETSHDCAQGYGYTVHTNDERKITVATDTGVVTDEMLRAMTGSDLVLLESNHDVGMLQTGPYPYYLKRRVLSSRGHLSNEACSKAASELLKTGTTRFVLGHLSKENNFPDLAYETTNSVFKQEGAKENFDYILDIAGKQSTVVL